MFHLYHLPNNFKKFYHAHSQAFKRSLLDERCVSKTNRPANLVRLSGRFTFLTTVTPTTTIKQAMFESLTARVVEFLEVIGEMIEMKQLTTRDPRANRRDLFAD